MNNILTCETCMGYGFILHRRKLGKEFRIKCPNCRGRGLIEHPYKPKILQREYSTKSYSYEYT